jgi:hypothetical protein
MDMWFFQYKNEPPFNSISTRGFLMGSTFSVVKQCKESLLREFRREIKEKLWLLKNRGDMWCMNTPFLYQRPSFSWVTMMLSIISHVDYNENLLVPASIYLDYSLLSPIKEAQEYEVAMSNGIADFKPGFTNFIHELIMSTPDIIFMEVKMGRIVEALVRNMWPVPQSFRFSWYLKQLVTLEHLSDMDDFRG